MQTLCWRKTSPSFSGAHRSCISRSINIIFCTTNRHVHQDQCVENVFHLSQGFGAIVSHFVIGECFLLALYVRASNEMGLAPQTCKHVGNIVSEIFPEVQTKRQIDNSNQNTMFSRRYCGLRPRPDYIGLYVFGGRGHLFYFFIFIFIYIFFIFFIFGIHRATGPIGTRPRVRPLGSPPPPPTHHDLMKIY